MQFQLYFCVYGLFQLCNSIGYDAFINTISYQNGLAVVEMFKFSVKTSTPGLSQCSDRVNKRLRDCAFQEP
jgi:hypothetical protein